MMRSVVLHSLLFCRHGEHPPGRASQRILRICRVSHGQSTSVSTAQPQPPMPASLVCTTRSSLPCTGRTPGLFSLTRRRHLASCCRLRRWGRHVRTLSPAAAAADVGCTDGGHAAAGQHRSWRSCSATRRCRQPPPAALWMASSAEHARRVNCSALFVVYARTGNARRRPVALILRSNDNWQAASAAPWAVDYAAQSYSARLT